MSNNEKVVLRPFIKAAATPHPNEIPEGVRMIEAPSFWKQANEGKGSVVAIIDTGVTTQHPDLRNQIIGGRNFTTDYRGNKNKFEDNNGHGTHVAGTIAAAINGRGVVGVAPQAKLLILKVLTADGSGQYDWMINAIHYACDWRGPNGETVSVINMSLGGPVDIPALHDAVKRAVNEKNIPIVCAAGNEGDNNVNTNEYDYPASYHEVISVGAVSYDMRLAPFSNTNEEIDLVAPGVDIVSTYLDNQYAILSGTSMAAPHVAGALALIKVAAEQEFGRRLTESELYAQLIKRTVPLNYTKRAVGNGLVQLNYMDKYRELLQFINTNFAG